MVFLLRPRPVTPPREGRRSEPGLQADADGARGFWCLNFAFVGQLPGVDFPSLLLTFSREVF